MKTIAHRQKSHRDAGALNERIAMTGFVDEPTGSTFLTKSGAVGRVFRLKGVDYESADHAKRALVVHRFEAALRAFGPRFRVREYLWKSRVGAFDAPPCLNTVADAAIQQWTDDLNDRRDDLFKMDLYVVVEREGSRGQQRVSLSKTRTIALLKEDLDRRVEELHRATDGFQVALADVLQPARLSKQKVYDFLRRLLNPAPHKQTAPLRSDRHVDYFAADSAVEILPDHLRLDGRYVAKVLTMKDPPARTFPNQLVERLSALPGEFVACLEWQRSEVAIVRRDLWWRSRHFVSSSESAGGASKNLIEAAKVAMEVDGHAFGECSLTMVAFDTDAAIVHQAAADAIAVMATHDGALYEETDNCFNAWLAILPGNDADNLRRMRLMDLNLADLSFVFSLDQGSSWSTQLNAPPLVVLETVARTPYWLDMHEGDVGHSLTVGGIGSGKSVGTAFFLMHAQQYSPMTVVFDMGHSYRKLAHALDGSYLELGLANQAVQLNPFSLPLTDSNVEFLHGFVSVLLTGPGDAQLTEYERRVIYDAIVSFRDYPPEYRRLLSLTLTGPLQERLEKWLEGGRYPLFDHVEDTLAFRDFQVFEFGGVSRLPEVLDPLLFYVQHRVRLELGRRLVIQVMDEAWRAIQHPIVRDHLIEGLKTWRKLNAAIWLVTQTLDDFSAEGLLRPVLENCPTVILRSNPAFNRAQYADLLRLTDVELDLVERIQPHRQLFVKRPSGSKLLELNIRREDVDAYYSNDALRMAARGAA
jgi:type IV secretory pathway VirB4 component